MCSPPGRSHRRLLPVACLILAAGSAWSCAPKEYTLTLGPTRDVRSYRHIQVAPVQTKITEDSLESQTSLVLRSAIIDAVRREKAFASVEAQSEQRDSTLQVDCTIVQFVKGSQATRWLLGFGAGKGHLNVSCSFADGGSGDVVAEGTFAEDVKGGWFGGSVNQEKMSEKIAKKIAKFLKKGK